MSEFTGQLRSNEIFAALYNMIISQWQAVDNIKGTNSKLVDMARTDGSLYGDTKLYYFTDALKSHAWEGDAEASNLLALDRPAAPSTQAITLSVFRQIRLTVDNYLSKRAWSDEGSFAAFSSVMMGWIGDTKRIYDSTTYNAYIGTATGESAKATLSVALSDIEATGEEKNRLEGETIARFVADLFTDMEDVTRDYNDYGYIRSYSRDDIKLVWNADYLNKIQKVDLPSIFHNEALVNKLGEIVLPPKYFGTVNVVATKAVEKDAGSGEVVYPNLRSMVEQDIGSHHYFAGEAIKVGDTAPAGTSYTMDDTIICKVMTVVPPYMSAFQVGTDFFNPRSLTETQYLTWGHNPLEYLKGYPLSVVKAA